MKLKDESDYFVASSSQLVIAQCGYGFIPDRNRARVGLIEQAENIKKRAFSAAGWSDNRVNRSRLKLQRDAAQCVHARFIFSEITLDLLTAEANFRIHTLDPRSVATGGSSAARRAGT